MNTTQARQPSLYTPPVGVIGEIHLSGIARRCIELLLATPGRPGL